MPESRSTGRFADFFDSAMPGASGEVAPQASRGGATNAFFQDSQAGPPSAPPTPPPTPSPPPPAPPSGATAAFFESQLKPTAPEPEGSGSFHGAPTMAMGEGGFREQATEFLEESVVNSKVSQMAAQQAAAPAGPFQPAAGVMLGEFRLERKLGQGGMGEVWLATQMSLDRPVAVKLLPAAFSSQPQFVERFEREAKSAASLVHPNVIQIYAYGIVASAPYFAMEYVEGEDLQQRLARQGQRPLSEIMELMIGVASALAAAGDKDLVHRDIKPSNVMLGASGTIKVMDFGLAKATSLAGASLTQSGLIMGTPKYMSPEQARGDTVDKRSDIYSLGIVFYELLTGVLPFRSDTPAGLIFKHVYEAPPAPRVKNEDIPPFLEEVVLRMIEKDPESRYSSAHELLTDLREFQSNRAYYLAGGARREVSGDETVTYTAADGRSGGASFQEQPTAVGPSPTGLQSTPSAPITTVEVRTDGGGLRFFVLFALLLLIAAAVAWVGHREGHWVLPYLPPRVIEDGPKPPVDKPPEQPPVNPPPKPRATVDFAFDMALAPQVEALWNGRQKDELTPLVVGRSYEVEPGAYTLVLRKPGRKPLRLGIVVDEQGRGRELEAKTPLGELRPNFEPLPALVASYTEGLAALGEGRYEAAIAELSSASQVDPEFRSGAEAPSVVEALGDARERLEQRQSNERRWGEALSQAQAHASSKDWRAARVALEGIPDEFSQAAAARELAATLDARLEDIAARQQGAAEDLRGGDLPKALASLQALADEDPKNEEVGALLSDARRGAELLDKARQAADKGLSAIQANDYEQAKAPLLEAQAAYQTYLDAIAPRDARAEAERARLGKLLSENSSLSELIQRLQDALAAQSDREALELAREVLARDKDNPVAQAALRDSDRRIKVAATARALERLDAALTAKGGAEVAALLARMPAEAARMKDFLKVARFARSEHKPLEVQTKGPDSARITARVQWTLVVDYVDIDRRIEYKFVQTLTLEPSGRDDAAWLITDIAR